MRALNPSQALATTMVDELARCGVTHAVLAPGSRSAPLAMALAGDSRIALHVVIDERSASFLALGIAKAGRRPVVVACTSGTAAANFHPAVIEAHLSRTPLIVITADRPPELRDTGANQTIDQIKLYGDAVRLFAEVGTPETRPEAPRYWRSLACRAYASASGSPPGPVHLNAPFREPLVPVAGDGDPLELGGRADGEPWTSVGPSRAAPSEAGIEAVAERVAASERGLVVAGACDIDPEPVLELAHTASWPVLAEPASGLRAGPNAVSAYNALLHHEGFAARNRPDFVLRVGKAGLSRSLSRFLGPDVPQVLIDADGAWLDPERSIDAIVAADPALLCGEVAKALPGRITSPWLTSWQGADERAGAAIDNLLDADDAVSEPRTARDLARYLPNGANLVVASSMPVRDLDSFMAPRTGLRVLANRGANGIDGFVSTVLGIALATTSPTFALAGDLSMLHDANGLMLARTEGVDAVFVVVNNDGGGIFSFLPQAEFPEDFERLFGTPHGIDLGALATLHGCGHSRVEYASELPEALSAARNEGGVQMIELRTDRDANVALHMRLIGAVATALD